MEQKQKNIGANIATLRKAKNLTQEQLAAKLGISAPAVSKWETGNSYPDITLLCPLARALDTNVDTLLQFEETLPDSEVIHQINALIQAAIDQGTPAGWKQAENRLEELLHRYPNCTALQYNGAATYDVFQMFSPTADESTKTQWQLRKRELLEDVRAAGSAAYWQSATLQLASMAMTEGKLEQGAALLKTLPQHTGDPTSVWALYHLKKEDPEEALKITQQQLYKLVHQIQTCLVTLMNPKLLPAPERQLKVSLAYRKIAQIFGLLDLSDGLLIECYLKMGAPEKAAACFTRYVDIVTGPAVYPDKDLFAPGVHCQKPAEAQATTKELRRLLLNAVTQEEQYRSLLHDPAFAAALDRLKASV